MDEDVGLKVGEGYDPTGIQSRSIQAKGWRSDQTFVDCGSASVEGAYFSCIMFRIKVSVGIR